MTKYIFKTPGAIPVEAFTTFGLNAKPRAGGHPIGYFGTGLKYAVAIILRHGGRIQLFIDGTEYEFYTYAKDFRGKEFHSVRMKKRKGALSKWRSQELPFTTELGKNWELWQAFRELESNTRDEQGESYALSPQDDDGEDFWTDEPGTLIVVDCPGFAESAKKGEVFFDPESEQVERVHDAARFSIYDRPSRHLYYRGIRVYTFRHPARFTYDVKAGYLELSEDRTAKNIWLVQWNIQNTIMELEDEYLLRRMFEKGDGEKTFEGEDLSFEDGGGWIFRTVAKQLHETGTGARSISRYYLSLPEDSDWGDTTTEMRLKDSDWELIISRLLGEECDEDECKRVADYIRERF